MNVLSIEIKTKHYFIHANNNINRIQILPEALLRVEDTEMLSAILI